MQTNDDYLLMARPPFDPFVRMQEKDIDCVYQRNSMEHWGAEKLAETMEGNVDLS
jgi:hypothetical protein